MISLACSACGKALKVQDSLAGKRVKCPACGKPTAVPSSSVSRTEAGKRSPVPPSGSLPQGRPVQDRRPAASATSSDALTLAPRFSPPAHSSGSDTFAGALGPEGEYPEELTEFLAPAQAPDEIGRLGSYRVLAILGHGGMGAVFRAEDPLLKRLVALKVMLPALAGSGANRTRFLREAQAAAAVKNDHVVSIHQIGEERGVPFVAMELLDGQPLDDRLTNGPALTLGEVLRIGRETAQGLAAAHKRGLIHRDIKPANLWLEGEMGRVKILDFGLARTLSDETHLTRTGAILGTPAYMAPEQAGGREVDHRCDLFSLGCVLYRMCTGEMPFKGKDTITIISALALETPKPPRIINPGVPPALSDLVMWLLAKNPEERPASAEEVVRALQAIEAGADCPAAQPSRKPKASARLVVRPDDPTEMLLEPEGASRRRWWIGAAVALLLLAAGGTAALLKAGRSHPGEEGVSREQQRPEEGTSEALPPTYTNSLGMDFVLVPKGKSWLGGGGGKLGDRQVEITEDFYLGKYEVTQEEWEKVLGKNPCYFSRPGHYDGKGRVKNISDADLKRFPVEFITWEDAQQFVHTLNALENVSGWVYRLPREMEWEYACRGGPAPDPFGSVFSFYLDKPTNQLLPDQANFSHDKCFQRTCKVGSYKPNRLGLYDMHGNVAEWCEDAVNNDGRPARVLRGGGWGNASYDCSAVSRRFDGASRHSLDCMVYGMRLARVPVGK